MKSSAGSSATCFATSQFNLARGDRDRQKPHQSPWRYAIVGTTPHPRSPCPNDSRSPKPNNWERSPLVLPLYFQLLALEQEQMRILLISSPTWVAETIHDLHARGFADPNAWSSKLPGANPDEVVSILTRRRQRP